MHYTQLMDDMLSQFRLDPDGPHGPSHWARVFDHGMKIADSDPRVDRKVVALFAILHDSQRWNDDYDPEHGKRAATTMRKLASRDRFRLTKEQDLALFLALELHSCGMLTASPTIQACWDADRLDLGRVWIQPDPHLMGSEYAKRPDVIAAAYKAGRTGAIVLVGD